jgi:hypothetical protein
MRLTLGSFKQMFVAFRFAAAVAHAAGQGMPPKRTTPGGAAPPAPPAQPTQQAEQPAPPPVPLGQEPAEPPEWPHAFRLQVTVFQVELAAAGLVQLDSQSLATQGATPPQMAEALGKLGAVKPLLRIDQPVAMGRAETRITVGQDMPYPVGVSTTQGGQTSTQIQRQRVGGKLDLHGSLTDERHARVDLGLEFTAITPGDVDSGAGVKAPSFWSIDHRTTAVLALGKPHVMVSAKGETTLAGDKVLAFVTLVALTPLSN